MRFERINQPELGPAPGFSHAVVATGTVVHLAGQTALDSAGRITGDGIVEQFRVALERVLLALTAAGGQPATLASMTIYVRDIADYRRNAARIGKVWRELMGRDYPAMAAIEIGRLWDEDALVELQGVAVIAG